MKKDSSEDFFTRIRVFGVGEVAASAARQVQQANLIGVECICITTEFLRIESNAQVDVAIDSAMVGAQLVFILADRNNTLCNQIAQRIANAAHVVDAVVIQVQDNFLLCPDLVQDIITAMVEQTYLAFDFEDLRTILNQPGDVQMGIGLAEGTNCFCEAANLAKSRLSKSTLSGAKALLVLIAGSSMKLRDGRSAVNVVRAHASANAFVIYAMTEDAAMSNTIRVTIIATGLENE